MRNEDCWCGHMKRWHLHGVCSWCARNERNQPGRDIGEASIYAPPRHQFATEEPPERQAKRDEWYEKTFGRRPRQRPPLEIIVRSREANRHNTDPAKERCWCRHLKRWHQDGLCIWCARKQARYPNLNFLPEHEFGGEAELEKLALEWFRRHPTEGGQSEASELIEFEEGEEGHPA